MNFDTVQQRKKDREESIKSNANEQINAKRKHVKNVTKHNGKSKVKSHAK